MEYVYVFLFMGVLFGLYALYELGFTALVHIIKEKDKKAKSNVRYNVFCIILIIIMISIWRFFRV